MQPKLTANLSAQIISQDAFFNKMLFHSLTHSRHSSSLCLPSLELYCTESLMQASVGVTVVQRVKGRLGLLAAKLFLFKAVLVAAGMFTLVLGVMNMSKAYVTVYMTDLTSFSGQSQSFYSLQNMERNSPTISTNLAKLFSKVLNHQLNSETKILVLFRNCPVT